MHVSCSCAGYASTDRGISIVKRARNMRPPKPGGNDREAGAVRLVRVDAKRERASRAKNQEQGVKPMESEFKGAHGIQRGFGRGGHE